MELHEALSHIAEIRERVAVAERFRGYRSTPVAVTGLLAVVAAVAQPHLVPDPAADLSGYLGLWLSTAALGAAVAAAGIVYRHRFASHPLDREMTRLAVSQFAPCLIAGALVTLVIVRHAPESAGMLPGLWQVLFSLGVFASCRLLPRAIVGVAVFYLLAGVLTLAWAQGPSAFSPWGMGVGFGVGQWATAAVLYWHLERAHAD